MIQPIDRKLTEKILLVEDHSYWRGKLARILRENGFRVTPTANRSAALHNIGIDYEIAVVVLDIYIDGDTLGSDEINRVARLLGIPVVVVSGAATKSQLASLFFEYEIVAFVEKAPFDRSKLELAMRKALEKRKSILREGMPAVMEVVMNKFTAENVLSQGTGTHIHDINWNQLWIKSANGIDLVALASELAQLRIALKETGAASPEQDMSIGAVAAAEQCASKGDGEGALERLRHAGKWALDTATKIGVNVASKAIQAALFGPGA